MLLRLQFNDMNLQSTKDYSWQLPKLVARPTYWHSTPSCDDPLQKRGRIVDNVQLDQTLIKKTTATFVAHNVIKVKDTKPRATLNNICLKRGAGWY